MNRVSQVTSSHCGPAVLQMLLSFIGYDVSQKALVEAAAVEEIVSEYGMILPEMTRALNKLTPDLNFWYKRNSTLLELKQIVNIHKFPAGVAWQGVFLEYSDDEDDGHYSIVTRVDSAQGIIYIADPYEKFAGKDRILGTHLFEKHWWEISERIDPETGLIKHIADDRTMFVITPSHIHFPSDLGMEKG